MASKINQNRILDQFFGGRGGDALFSCEAVSAYYGAAGARDVYAVWQGGAALGAKDVDKIIRVLDLAAQTGCPVVTFYNSVGAKLAEGLDALTAAARLNAAVARYSGVIPQVAVVLGVCGGTSAMAAANVDLCVMAEGAELFFTPPFTSAAKGDKVEGAGTAAAAAKAGVAAVVARTAEEAAAAAARLVQMLPANNLSAADQFECAAPAEKALKAGAGAAKAAAAVTDAGSCVELYAGYGKNVFTGLATIGGMPAGVVVTGEKLCRNCVSKASRLIRLCDAFNLPVVTVVDTEGFVPSVTDDIAGGLREAARLAATCADATCPRVSLLYGKAVGPVYTAFAAADLRVAVRGCTISPIEPTAAVSVLYKEELDAADSIAAATQAKAAAYRQEVCSADAAVAAGAADTACDPSGAYGAAVQALQMMRTKRAARLPKKHGNMAL
ncbi:MAG TPA: propionyl-CoA carboxylase [Candidatus Faecalibacterium faecipullorum]|uniref:Propionyl-CoA carboxylase n=1 Tax=Candidatus Faecalibacterium faecipullorum TaxID=2838578 RepID=A0A9D2MGV6_9FIRM|nr:propionyl-CoA carboxylase [Candidatus Faecalibacterium faecipullorum]